MPRCGGVLRGLIAASGAAALVYQVAWTRSLALVFGVSSHAAGTVLAAFLGGLALGAFILGGAADRSARPLRLYALLEAGIGLDALAFPPSRPWWTVRTSPGGRASAPRPRRGRSSPPLSSCRPRS